jgi:hypothetical protein
MHYLSLSLSLSLVLLALYIVHSLALAISILVSVNTTAIYFKQTKTSCGNDNFEPSRKPRFSFARLLLVLKIRAVYMQNFHINQLIIM